MFVACWCSILTNILKHRSEMKYFFGALLLSCFVAMYTNSLLSTTRKPVTPKFSQCNVNNNRNYNGFFAGPNCKKIENMLSEVKQQLAEIKQEISEIRENQTSGAGEKGLWQKLFETSVTPCRLRYCCFNYRNCSKAGSKILKLCPICSLQELCKHLPVR